MRSRRTVAVRYGECFGKFARRIDLTANNVKHRACARLTRKTAVYYGVRVVAPARFNRASAGENEYKFFAVCPYLLVKRNLVCGNIYMFPVKTFRFGHFVKTQTKNYGINSLCKFYGVFNEAVFLFSVSVEALFVTDEVDFVSVFEYGGNFRGVDHGRTCTLVSWKISEIAYNRSSRFRRQRKNTVILQKHYALFRALFSKLVMGFGIERLTFFCYGRLFYEVEYESDALVDVFYVKRTVFYRFDYISRTVLAGRHFKVAARNG